jgi:cytochrome c oxidase cbb3-type subunit 2
VQQCARCHGDAGKGDGYYGKRLYPKPRDLTSGVYKFRSTASGTSPTDEDLFHTVTHGLPAGNMPDWPHLDEATRWQLVYYLKTLSPAFTDQPPQPVDIGRDPGVKHADLKRGRAVYEQLGCAACHGVSGRANGTSAAGLVDDWGQAIRPADLTQGWSYRGGSEPREIATRILTGISGAPMPSYAEATTPDDVWQLAYYVRSLQQEPRWTMLNTVPQVAHLPTSIDDVGWQAAKRVDLRLRLAANAQGEVTAPSTVTAVSVWAVTDGTQLGLRLQWHDPSEDRTEALDAVAVALRPTGVLGDRVSLQYWPLRDSPPLDVSLWSSAHPDYAVEGVVKRYESLLAPSASGLSLPAHARYDDGVWTVMLMRPMEPAQPVGGAQLTSARVAPIAFVVWDGGNPHQRAVSGWLELIIGPQGGHGDHRTDAAESSSGSLTKRLVMFKKSK